MLLLNVNVAFCIISALKFWSRILKRSEQIMSHFLGGIYVLFISITPSQLAKLCRKEVSVTCKKWFWSTFRVSLTCLGLENPANTSHQVA